MVYQFDGGYLTGLPRKSCRFQKLQEELEGKLSEDDLTKEVEGFVRHFPQSKVGQAGMYPRCHRKSDSPDLRRSKKEEQEVILSHWDSEVADKFRKEIEEDMKLHAEGCMSREGPCLTLTILGVSSLFVRGELVEELAKYGLHVDGTKDCRGLIWKAPYRPSLASADEIPVVLALRRNEAKVRWQ
eukprot:763621-Hanusia_phi.AAC.3